MLTLALQCHPSRTDVRDRAEEVAQWIVNTLHREPRVLPGLYFGRAGTAWSLAEAGETLDRPDLVAAGRDIARRLPVTWPNPDVAHGLAGSGLTYLRFLELTKDEQFADRAQRSAEAIAGAARSGSGGTHWQISLDFESTLSGLIHHGFAHGTAGIAMFLLAAGEQLGDDRYTDLAVKSAEALELAAQHTGRRAFWAKGPLGDQFPRTNWCSGSSGVGTFLIRLWARTRDERWLSLSVSAAEAVRDSRWRNGTSHCHGIAGDGEFLLDLYQATGQEKFKEWAEELALVLGLRSARHPSGRLVPDETGVETTSDFGTGSSGVTAFLMRLAHPRQPRLWLPRSVALLP
jgi:hypothetical protein